MSIFLTFIVIAIILLCDSLRTPKYKIDAFRFSLLFYVLIYFLIAELLPLSYACSPYCGGVPWLPRLVALAGLGALAAGYALASNLPVIGIHRRVYISNKREYGFLVLISIISLMALYAYASSYGGIAKALSFGALQRYSGQKYVEVGGSAVALYFVSMAYIVFVFSQWKIYQGGKYKKKYIFLLFINLAIIVIYGLIQSSRGALFGVLLLSIFIHINGKKISFNFKKVYNLKFILPVVLVFGIGLWVVAYGKSAIGAISAAFRGEGFAWSSFAADTKSLEYIYGRLILEFSHSIKSLATLIPSDVSNNYFLHFWSAPLHLIPTRLFGIAGDKPYRLTEINTELLTGAPDGGIPPGLVASFWYGFGLLGVILGLGIFGIFIGWLQRQCYSIIRVYPEAAPGVLYLFYSLGWFVNNGEPSIFLKNNVHLLAFLLLVLGASLTFRVRFSPGIGAQQYSRRN